MSASSTKKEIAFSVFTLLWVADTFLTVIGVADYGLDAEGNPLMRRFIEAYGLDGFLSAKLAILGLWWIIYPLTKLWHQVFLAIVMTPVVLGWIMVLYF